LPPVAYITDDTSSPGDHPGQVMTASKPARMVMTRNDPNRWWTRAVENGRIR
jgi:hypothetical protein